MIEYRCCECGAEGVRLWRKYQTVMEAQDLKCRACAEEEARPAREERRRKNPAVADILERQQTDQIGWRVPAVPVLGEDTFWGYTSVPPDRVAWWKGLPEVPAG